jgi:hypothetical protein
MIMIIRREVINFALENNHKELLEDPEQFYKENYQECKNDDDPELNPLDYEIETDLNKNMRNGDGAGEPMQVSVS